MPKKKCIRRPIKRLEFKKYEKMLHKLDKLPQRGFFYEFLLPRFANRLTTDDLAFYASSYVSKDNLKSALELIKEWEKKEEYRQLDWNYMMHCLLDYMDKAFGRRKGRIAPDPVFATQRSQKDADRLVELLTDLKNKLKPFESWYSSFYFHDEIGCKGDVLKTIDNLTRLIDDEKKRETHRGPKGNMRKNVLVLRLWSHLVIRGKATSDEALCQIADLHLKLSAKAKDKVTDKTKSADSETHRLRKMATRAIDKLLSIYN